MIALQDVPAKGTSVHVRYWNGAAQPREVTGIVLGTDFRTKDFSVLDASRHVHIIDCALVVVIEAANLPDVSENGTR